MGGLTGLVLTGGGARGAYQAGALVALAEVTGARALPFPILAGSSAGSINCAYLASRAHDFPAATRALADLWTGLEPARVYRTGTLQLARTAAHWLTDLGLGGFIGSGRGKALFDTEPLRELLEANFDPAAVAHAIGVGHVHGLGITATDYENGLGVTFYDGAHGIEPWTRVTRVGKRASLSVDHILASSAIPMFFPAVQVEGDWYADGSIRLSTPLSPAIRMGADRLLAIAVRQADVGEPHAHAQDGAVHAAAPPYPSAAEMAGVLLNALFLEALESDVERTTRINHTLSLVPKELLARKATQLRPVEVMVLRPSRDPSTLVLRTIERLPATVRHFFRGLGASDTEGWDLLSYLGFDAEYTARLFQLGYDDTVTRADEIRTFLRR